jgi:hypothetical protein
MRIVSWRVFPVVLAALLGQIAPAAETLKPGSVRPAFETGKPRDPATIRANKTAMFASSKPNPAVDPNNVAPPTGAILDLSGTPVSHTFQSYSVSFVANLTSTAITFAFREDPAFLSLEQVTVVDQTVPGANLLTNGDFSGGTNGGTPVGWTYANVYGAQAGGVVETSGCGGPQPSGACWYDGAVQAYDAISQNITTVVGHTYKISFYLSDNGPYSTFSNLSTNGDVTGTGGNGVDLLVYAQAGLPAPAGATTPTANAAPALSTGGLFLLGLLLAAAGWVQVRRGLRASS